MHARLGPCYLRERSQFVSNILDQAAPAFGIQQPHPPDMARKIPFANEICEHRLMKSCRTDVHRKPDGEKALDKVRRNDHVTQPQRRKQHLAERTDVDDARIAVESLQGSYRHAFIAVLAVI